MRDFFKSFRFKIFIAFLAFLIGIMIYAVTKGGYAVSGASFINTVTQPFKKVSNNIAIKVETRLDKMSNADDYYNENQRLKKQISELNKQLTAYEDTKNQLEELRKFIGIKEKNKDFILSKPCNVTGYIANDPFMSFTIDKGSDDEIKPYCPVVTGDGLIGITIDVSAHSSTVRTLLSPDISIAAVTSSSDNAGIIEGSIEQAVAGKTMLKLVPKENSLKNGDLLVTTSTSGLFPKGYSIGTVESISLDTTGLSYSAVIQPSAKIDRLSSVMVITDFNGKDNSYEN